MLQRLCLLMIFGAVLSGCGRSPTPAQALTAVIQDTGGRPAQLISAFFGLDDALPRNSNRLCPGAAGQDGMPVIFSHTIDRDTLQKEDFLVITQAYVEAVPFCVTLLPAIGVGELRTVLVVGQLGSASADVPVTVRIVGDLWSDGATGSRLNFRGSEVSVIPLDQGPTLVWAEDVPQADWSDRGLNAGTDCPEGTVQVVRAVWAGGIRLPTGEEVGDDERALYRITVQQVDGTRVEVAPFALADLDDNDNNHSLCIGVTGTALSVSFPAGHVVDPNGDLNPNTEVAVMR